MKEIICHNCQTTFSPHDHGQGLVIDDHIFLCEDCTKHQPEDVESEDFSTSKQMLNNKMPIALWLIKEQNKGKTFMSGRK